MIDETALILSIRPLAQGYQVLTLAAPAIAAEAKPGQFVHVRVPSLDAARLRRPFSIYDADPVTGRLHILYKTVGLGTRHLAALPVGTELPVLGPIGRPFPLNPEGIPYLIGGGYGVAPLWFLASRLPRKDILFVGGRTAADILETDRFEEAGWEVRIATQDGSRGTMGLVTAPLDAALADKPQAELYACGPDGMLRAVGTAFKEKHLCSYADLEQQIAVCLSKSVAYRFPVHKSIVRICLPLLICVREIIDFGRDPVIKQKCGDALIVSEKKRFGYDALNAFFEFRHLSQVLIPLVSVVEYGAERFRVKGDRREGRQRKSGKNVVFDSLHYLK